MEQNQIEVLEKALKKYGKKSQMMICAEECSELIQAITKRIRYYKSETINTRENLIEEIADVIICIEYLKMIDDIDQSEIDLYISSKIKQLNFNISTIDNSSDK